MSENIVKYPDIITGKLPKSSSLFIFTVVTNLASYLVTFLGLKDLSISLRVIFFLVVFCVTLLVDVILLYVKERENYYYNCYLETLLNQYVAQIKNKNEHQKI